MSGVRKIFTWCFLICQGDPSKSLPIASSPEFTILHYSSSMCLYRKVVMRRKYISDYKEKLSASLSYIIPLPILAFSSSSCSLITPPKVSATWLYFLPVPYLMFSLLASKVIPWSTKTATMMTLFWAGLISRGSQLLLVCKPLPIGMWTSTGLGVPL